jgi:hypothetical protein
MSTSTATAPPKQFAALMRRVATRELIKLLQVADLPIPPDMHDDGHDDDILNAQDDGTELADILSRPHHPHMSTSERQYRENRERFVSRINWTAYRNAYRDALADMRADHMTSGLVRNHAGRRRRLIAGILSRTGCDNDPGRIDPVDQLIAIRRLSLLLDEHFDRLQLEDMGAYWEKCRLVLSLERGFVFALRPDDMVTIRIPIDFTGEQFIRELDCNIWDFLDVVEDSTLDGVFPS